MKFMNKFKMQSSGDNGCCRVRAARLHHAPKGGWNRYIQSTRILSVREVAKKKRKAPLCSVPPVPLNKFVEGRAGLFSLERPAGSPAVHTSSTYDLLSPLFLMSLNTSVQHRFLDVGMEAGIEAVMVMFAAGVDLSGTGRVSVCRVRAVARFAGGGGRREREEGLCDDARYGRSMIFGSRKKELTVGWRVVSMRE